MILADGIASEGKCPCCGAPLVYPRNDYAYCEECGFPDECRPDTGENERLKSEGLNDMMSIAIEAHAAERNPE